jgi:hypothetical protein
MCDVKRSPVVLRLAAHCIWIVLTVAALPMVSSAQESKYAGEFLEIPVGAKALALGGAYTAVANDESAFHWNPAGVSLTTHKLLGFMYSAEYGAPGSSLMNFYHIGFTMPMMNDVTVSANWERLSIGDLLHTPDLTTISVTDERAQRVREIYQASPDFFSDNDDAFVLSIARNNKFTLDWGWLYYKEKIEIPIGINFKIIHQSIGDFGSASGIGIDAGMMVRFSAAEFLLVPELGNISLGVAVSDITGTNLNWSTHRTQVIPMHLNAGGAYTQPFPRWRSTATLSTDIRLGEPQPFKIGLDMSYEDRISLRAGMNGNYFATGAGFNWEKKVDLNYSLSINTALGPEHRLSFAVNFDNLLKQEEPSEK